MYGLMEPMPKFPVMTCAWFCISKGFYCMEPGKDNAGDFCDPGFYCKEGSRTATPLDGITGTMLNYQLFFVWLCHVPFENSYMAEPNK